MLASYKLCIPIGRWHVVEVGLEGVQAKLKALGMYRGVMRRYPHPSSEEYMTRLAAYRGCQFQLDYAEAFEVVLRKYKA